MRIMIRAQLAIVGLPQTGKTTLGNALAAHLGLGCCHTDQFMNVPWSEQADEAMKYMPVRGIVEGITVARLFRRGFEPDCVVHLVSDPSWVRTGSMASLVRRGLSEYRGRVITLPAKPKLTTALAALGGQAYDKL